MTYQRRLLPFLSMILTMAWCIDASAALIPPKYQYVFDKANYEVLPGQVVPVKVYLEETVSFGDSWFTSPNQGLISGGVRVFFDQTPLPSDRAKVLSTVDILNNPQFTNLLPTLDVVSGSSAGMSTSVVNQVTQLIQGTPLTPSISRILLGTFNFTGGLVNNEVTHLRASDFDLSGSSIQNKVFNNLSTASFDLDSLILPATATITVIPEPSTLALLGLAGVAIARWQIRRLQDEGKQLSRGIVK